MKSKHFLLFGLLAWAAAAPLSSAPAPLAGAPGGAGETVVSLSVTGLISLAPDTVLAVVRQRKGEPLRLSVVNEDLKRIWKMGKFQDVKVEALPGPGGRGVNLVFAVSERPLIEELRFFGNKQVSDSDLKSKAALEAGQTFDQDRTAAAVRAIQDLYKEKDYYAAQVAVDTKPGTQAGKVVVNFRLDEGNRMKVEKIEFSGNQALSASRLRGAMKETKESGWFGGGSYDADKLSQDCEEILKLYAAEGYAKASLGGVGLDQWGEKGRGVVRNITEFDEANKRIVLKIKVEEGRLYRLAGVSFEGNSVLGEAELRPLVQSLHRKKDLFDRETFDRDVTRLRTLYSAKGYIYASVQPDFTWDEAAGKVSVRLAIRENGKAYIEDIRIKGNEITKEAVIRRVVGLKSGDTFDMEAVNAARMRIYNLGFFENVVYDTQPGSEMDKLILVFDVSPERKTGTLSLGAGYSSVQGLVGFLQVSQNNLFGNGQSVSAQWDFGDRTNSYSLSFTEPWFLGRPVSLGVDIFRSLQTQAYNAQGFDLLSSGGSLRLGYPLGNRWRVGAAYRYQTDEISNVQGQLMGITDGASHISAITPSISRDTRDNVFDPTRGSFNVLSVQLAGGFLGGDRSFMKPVFDSRSFFSTPVIFGQEWMRMFVLGLHGRLGWAGPYPGDGTDPSQVPTSERFFMGGTDTVRGYFERILGASQQGGGLYSVLTNVEYGFKPAPPIKLRAFYDAGNTWMKDGDIDWPRPYLYSSWGFGMLFTIPTSVIQIRLDWGFGLDPKYEVPGGRIHFNIGNIF